MTFIQFIDSTSEREWVRQRLQLGQPETVLQGEGLSVHAVPEISLEYLQQLNIPFRVIAEEDLPDILSERGYEYFTRMREQNPELLFWNAPLPPVRCVEISMLVTEYLINRAIEIIESYDGFDLRIAEPGAVVRVDPFTEDGPPGEFNAELKQEIKFFLPAENFDRLLNELSEEHIAGYDRASQILVLSDPDRALGSGD